MMMSLLMLLLMGLSTSSFFLPQYLTKIIDANKHSSAQLNFALEQENQSALKFARTKALYHSAQWLELSIKLAKTRGKAAYQLALYYQNQPKQAEFWYKSAIRLDYAKARVALAQYYFKQGQFEKSAHALISLPQNLSQSLIIAAQTVKINIALNLGKIDDVKAIVSEYAKQLQLTEQGQLLLADLSKYRVLKNSSPSTLNKLNATDCDNSIQLFATNLRHLKQLEQLVTEFDNQALSTVVCFSPVRYMAITALDCIGEPTKAINCNEINWQPLSKSINSRYVGVMLPEGGANVHYGILYFDAQDNVDVVAHEVSHLLGFVDEYPLVAGHVKCESSQDKIFSRNVSVLKRRYQGNKQTIREKILQQVAWAEYIKDSTPILQEVTGLNSQQYWQIGTPELFNHEVGVFISKTCDSSVNHKRDDFASFKPVSQQTKLQYFALEFPEVYILLLQDNPSRHLMPSFHYNIALASFQQGNISQAKDYLRRAMSWEHDIDRRNIVSQGNL